MVSVCAGLLSFIIKHTTGLIVYCTFLSTLIRGKKNRQADSEISPIDHSCHKSSQQMDHDGRSNQIEGAGGFVFRRTRHPHLWQWRRPIGAPDLCCNSRVCSEEMPPWRSSLGGAFAEGLVGVPMLCGRACQLPKLPSLRFKVPRGFAARRHARLFGNL